MVSTLQYLPNVVDLEYDATKCTGCRMCVEVCPQAVFAIEQKRAVIVDRDACMECGACANNCEPGAIVVRKGVGCAAAVIQGKLRGTEPTCDCGNDASCCG